MALGKHTKNPASGRIRKERADSLVKHLKKDYVELQNVNGNMKLGTLEKRLEVDSLSQVLKTLRAKRGKT